MLIGWNRGKLGVIISKISERLPVLERNIAGKKKKNGKGEFQKF